MKNKLKIQLVFSLFALSSIGLAACGGSDEGASGENGDSEEVELRFAWWGDTGRNEVYEEIISRFEEENPNIKISGEATGFEDYWDRLTTQVAGGNAPDIISMHPSYVSDYARRNALLSLDEYVEAGDINLDEFPEATRDSGKIDDTTYMVAKGVTMSGVVYNTEYFDEYGVETPGMDWTWNDFSETAIELAQSADEEGKFGSSAGSGLFRPQFQYFARQNGGELFTDDGQLGFGKKELIEWWEMWESMRAEGGIPDAATANEYENAALEENLFVSEMVGMHFIPANQLYLYQDQFSDSDIEITRTPQLEGGSEGEFIEGAYLSIPQETKHPEEAAKFIDFFVNSEESLEVFKVEQGSPGSTEMQEFVASDLSEAEQKGVDFNEETIENAERAPYPPEGVSEIEQAFSDYSTDIGYGEIGIEEAANDFMEEAESVLD